MMETKDPAEFMPAREAVNALEAVYNGPEEILAALEFADKQDNS